MVVQWGGHHGERKDEPAWALQANHRCIGCGLCVTTCSASPRAEQPYVPKDMVGEVKKWVKRHQDLKKLMAQISELSVGVIRRHVSERRAAGRAKGK